MANLVKSVERVAGDEEVLAVVIGPPSWCVNEVNNGADVPFGVILSWDE